MLAEKIEAAVLEELMAAGLNSFELSVTAESSNPFVSFTWIRVPDNPEIEHTLPRLELETNVFYAMKDALSQVSEPVYISFSSDYDSAGISGSDNCSGFRLLVSIH